MIFVMIFGRPAGRSAAIVVVDEWLSLSLWQVVQLFRLTVGRYAEMTGPAKQSGRPHFGVDNP